MAWQAVVLAVQILLLAAGWLLFQRARGELSARAAETPVLAEVKSLQKNVKRLLAEIEDAANRESLRIENGCALAADAIAQLEGSLRDAEARLAEIAEEARALEARWSAARAPAYPAESVAAPRYAAQQGQFTRGAEFDAPQGFEAAVANSTYRPEPPSEAASRRERIFALADMGQTTAAIAHATQLSEGEVETLLGLRPGR